MNLSACDGRFVGEQGLDRTRSLTHWSMHVRELFITAA